jgi:multiple sugar transport system substrate-binding protein
VPDVLTWDFIFEVSEKALEKNPDGTFKINGQKTMIPFIYKSTDNMMIEMLEQMGAQYTTADAKVLMFNETTKDILLDLVPHAQSRSFSTFGISSYPGNFLNAGQCIFAVDSTAGATWMGTDAPLSDISEENLVRFETAVRMIPQVDPDNPAMISQGPSVCMFNKGDPQEVLASWLFMQYLLTNEVQIAYSGTEGYVPVTSKAQESAEYQDYLSRGGEDNEHYYSVKLDAAKLLLDHTDDTFVTPVFNGSASLRNAAGQLIENTTKSVRRSETVDDAYMEKLYADITSLYRLDNLSSSVASGKADLGPLPTGSVVLLSVLCGVWLLIIGYFAKTQIKQKKKSKKNPNNP